MYYTVVKQLQTKSTINVFLKPTIQQMWINQNDVYKHVSSIKYVQINIRTCIPGTQVPFLGGLKPPKSEDLSNQNPSQSQDSTCNNHIDTLDALERHPANHHASWWFQPL